MNCKIAILLPNLRGGGAERVNVNLANEFAAKGFVVDIVVMRAFGELLPLLDPRVNLVDLRVDRMRGVFNVLNRYLKEAKPTALLASMWPLTVIAWASRATSGPTTRLVVAEHTTWSTSERGEELLHKVILASSMRVAFPRVDGVITVSSGAADDLAIISCVPRGRIRVIHNPVVGGARLPSQAGEMKVAAATTHPKILAVGTLKPIKDFTTLLISFSILLQRIPNAALTILGEGDDREVLEQTARRLGIDGRVFMPGFVHDTASYYAAADLFVLSSRGEGFGNVLVEALEHGLPIVSTDCRSGPREILANGRYGVLVPIGDSAAMAEAMYFGLTSEHDKAALRARAADFTVAQAAEAYLGLLVPGWEVGSSCARPRI